MNQLHLRAWWKFISQTHPFCSQVEISRSNAALKAAVVMSGLLYLGTHLIRSKPQEITLSASCPTNPLPLVPLSKQPPQPAGPQLLPIASSHRCWELLTSSLYAHSLHPSPQHLPTTTSVLPPTLRSSPHASYKVSRWLFLQALFLHLTLLRTPCRYPSDPPPHTSPFLVYALGIILPNLC